MRLQGPENCGGFSHEGHAFEVDATGCIEIPDDNEAAIVAAFSHGFAQVAETEPTPKKARKQ
jgi:hypothetical protein